MLIPNLLNTSNSFYVFPELQEAFNKCSTITEDGMIIEVIGVYPQFQINESYTLVNGVSFKTKLFKGDRGLGIKDQIQFITL